MQRIHPAASLSLASSSVFPMSLIGNAAPVHIGNVFQGIQKYCPEDYVCIVDAVKSSAVTSGNIAFIVELLKNISSNLQTSGIHDNVNWKKMKVLEKWISLNTVTTFLKSSIFNSFRCCFQSKMYNNHNSSSRYFCSAFFTNVRYLIQSNGHRSGLP